MISELHVAGAGKKPGGFAGRRINAAGQLALPGDAHKMITAGMRNPGKSA